MLKVKKHIHNTNPPKEMNGEIINGIVIVHDIILRCDCGYSEYCSFGVVM